jgi:hypothetical protein
MEQVPLRDLFKLVAPLAAKDPKYAQVLQELRESRTRDPLAWFDPHPADKDGRRPQLEFIQARPLWWLRLRGTGSASPRFSASAP